MLIKKFKIKIMAVALTAAMTIGMSTSVFATELLGNSTFENGIGFPWTEVEIAPAHAEWEVSNGKFNITVLGNGPDPVCAWDVQLRHRGLTLIQGGTYNVQFTIESPVDCKVYAKIGEILPNASNNASEYWNNTENPRQPFEIKAGVPLTVNETFTMKSPTSTTCEFVFYVANKMYTGPLPHLISFSNIHLDGPKAQTILVGDVNGDEGINMFDYIMLKKYIAGALPMLPYKYGEKAADVNGDGKVNVLDYVLIENFISGKVLTFPV